MPLLVLSHRAMIRRTKKTNADVNNSTLILFLHYIVCNIRRHKRLGCSEHNNRGVLCAPVPFLGSFAVLQILTCLQSSLVINKFEAVLVVS